MNPLNCKKCGTVITGGYYNTPRGAHCCDCWEKVPDRDKKKMLAETLRSLTNASRLLDIPIKL